jgi:NACHT domain
LSGWAGTGKSTIARTIAREYDNPQWQLGSFFFSKGGGDAGHIHKFVSTITMQLSYCWPAYKSALREAIAADEGIVRKTQKAQWAALVQKPLSGLLASSSPPHVLLVIDAVDECGSDGDMNYIVELLLDAREINQTALRIFVTSRPEVAIRSGFDRDLDQHHFNLVLHQISEFIVQNDLFIFLRSHFANIRQSRGLGADWPGDAAIRRLVAMSGNLFIWAATVCRFVADGRTRARNRLLSILKGGYDFGGPDMALDRIYLMVLESAIGNNLSTEEKREVSHNFRYMLGTVAVLFAPLSITDLSCLLDVETEDFKETLADLHSIIDVPNDTACPIRLHHPSFRDFLCDQGRCRNEALCVDRFVMHRMLAKWSFKTMSILRRDICYLNDHGTMVEDVEPAVIQRHMSGAL